MAINVNIPDTTGASIGRASSEIASSIRSRKKEKRSQLEELDELNALADGLPLDEGELEKFLTGSIGTKRGIVASNVAELNRTQRLEDQARGFGQSIALAQFREGMADARRARELQANFLALNPSQELRDIFSKGGVDDQFAAFGEAQRDREILRFRQDTALELEALRDKNRIVEELERLENAGQMDRDKAGADAVARTLGDLDLLSKKQLDAVLGSAPGVSSKILNLFLRGAGSSRTTFDPANVESVPVPGPDGEALGFFLRDKDTKELVPSTGFRSMGGGGSDFERMMMQLLGGGDVNGSGDDGGEGPQAARKRAGAVGAARFEEPALPAAGAGQPVGASSIFPGAAERLKQKE